MTTIFRKTGAALGAAAISAIGAAVLLAAAPARAAAGASPFAGRYSAPANGATWIISISSHGAVNGSYNESHNYGDYGAVTYRGSMSGIVSDAGALSVDAVETVTWKRLPPSGEPTVGQHGNGSGGSSTTTSSYHIDATVGLDAGGDVVGATGTGWTFVWTRL